MSISWTQINPVLLDLLSSLGLPDSSTPAVPQWFAEWKDRPLKAVNTTIRASLFLTITSCTSIGDDERRLVFVPANASGADAPFRNKLRETVVGQRKFTLSLRCDSLVNDDSSFAFAMLERIRTRIRRGSSIAALDAIEVALIDRLPTRNISSKRDKHILSQAAMDLIFGTVAADDNPIPVGWVETIHYSTAFEDFDGTVLPAPINATDQIVSAAS